MTFLLLIIVLVAGSGESRSEARNAFLGFLMLSCVGLALLIVFGRLL
jgi:hypothetical protein